MPSDTFNHLPKEKKIRIMRSATKEFSNYTLREASINRIIKEANISRGSFYMYFKNIMDIYKYVVTVYKNKIKEVFLKYLKINHGDLFQSFIDIYDYVIETGSKQANRDFCKKIYTNLSIRSMHASIEKQDLFNFNTIIDLVDCKKLNITSEEEFRCMLGTLISLTIRFVVPVLVFNKSRETTRETLLLHFELLKKGFYR